jgi:hypothetical protein
MADGWFRIWDVYTRLNPAKLITELLGERENGAGVFVLEIFRTTKTVYLHRKVRAALGDRQAICPGDRWSISIPSFEQRGVKWTAYLPGKQTRAVSKRFLWLRSRSSSFESSLDH